MPVAISSARFVLSDMPVPISGVRFVLLTAKVSSKMDEWRQVNAFPNYSVSDAGSVMNEKTGRVMKVLSNRTGSTYVGLIRNGQQYNRSVPLIVAQAFVMSARKLSFDTPINLDGDRFNNRADNLVWRPRWFAVKYFDQFKNDTAGFPGPIEEMQTHEQFKSSWDAAVKFGLLNVEVILAIVNETQVWPTYQWFQSLRN